MESLRREFFFAMDVVPMPSSFAASSGRLSSTNVKLTEGTESLTVSLTRREAGVTSVFGGVVFNVPEADEFSPLVPVVTKMEQLD